MIEEPETPIEAVLIRIANCLEDALMPDPDVEPDLGGAAVLVRIAVALESIEDTLHTKAEGTPLATVLDNLKAETEAANAAQIPLSIFKIPGAE